MPLLVDSPSNLSAERLSTSEKQSSIPIILAKSRTQSVMDTKAHNPPYAGPPAHSPPEQTLQKSYDSKASIMEIDNMNDRAYREQSVLSGMSIEDMEAAETLNSLHKEFHSPQSIQVPSTHIQIATSYNDDQPEPLLSLVTSQYPLAGAVINGSLSAYKTTQSYIPGAEWTERNVGLPIAGTVARISGVEGGLRWALKPKRDVRSRGNNTPKTPDVEKGLSEVNGVMTNRRESDNSVVDSLPPYNAADRSPPYEQQATVTRSRQPPPGWRQQLVISTSGLGIAMSEESLRSLRYCLSWLRWANGRLDGAITNLKDLLEQWSQDPASQQSSHLMVDVRLSQTEVEGRQAVLTARIASLKGEVLQTLKQVVNVVSTYAGGALPENARNLVHRHLTSLPQRFSIASAHSSNGQTEEKNDAASSAGRVLVLAQEGLDMMTQVSRVVNDTLVSAESWCEKLGRRTGREGSSSSQPSIANLNEKQIPRERSMTIGGEDEKEDVQMQM